MSRRRFILLVVLLCLVALSGPATTIRAGDEVIYGELPGEGVTVPLSELLEHPDRYVGKAVVIEGAIVDVCPMRGCWIDVAAGDTGPRLRYKVKDGEIVFPLTAKGKQVRAAGVFVKQELSHDQAIGYQRHLAEERGEPFDPESVPGPLTLYRIEGHAAVVR